MEVGEPVMFELNSADISGTAAAITLRSRGGSARTLAADESLTILQIWSHVNATVTVCIMFDDVDGSGAVGAGELIAVWQQTQNNIPGMRAVCSLGRLPKVKGTGSGQVYVGGHGFITKG